MTDNLVTEILNWIIDTGINGFGVLPPAQEVAEQHRRACNSTEEAIDSVITWKTAHATGTGFATGLGGIATLPITLPLGLASSYALAANTAAAIAILRGYDAKSDQVRTFVLLSLVGNHEKEILKSAGVTMGSFELLKNLKPDASGFRFFVKVVSKALNI